MKLILLLLLLCSCASKKDYQKEKLISFTEDISHIAIKNKQEFFINANKKLYKFSNNKFNLLSDKFNITSLAFSNKLYLASCNKENSKLTTYFKDNFHTYNLTYFEEDFSLISAIIPEKDVLYFINQTCSICDEKPIKDYLLAYHVKYNKLYHLFPLKSTNIAIENNKIYASSNNEIKIYKKSNGSLLKTLKFSSIKSSKKFLITDNILIAEDNILYIFSQEGKIINKLNFEKNITAIAKKNNLILIACQNDIFNLK